MAEYSAPVICEGAGERPEALAATLADGFSRDPVFNWVIPYPPLYRDFFQLIVRDIYLRRGIIHREEQNRGVALWLPPGERFEIPPRLEMLRLLARLVGHRGPQPLWRIHRQGRLFSRHHPREPHFYLQFIACRQRDQGCGVGAALLKHGTRLCDRHHMPAYLESSNERNLALYQRHGFEIVHSERLPGGGPTGWFMWRERR